MPEHKSLVSLEMERRALAGLLKNSSSYFDISSYVSDKDFSNSTHRTIFNVVKSQIENNSSVDSAIIAEKIKDLGVTFKDGLNIFEYLESLSRSQVNEKGTKEAFAKLFDLRIRRELVGKSNQIANYIVNESLTSSINEVVAHCDSLYNSTNEKYVNTEDAVDIFSVAEDLIEELGNNPMEELGFPTPFSEFSKFYGGLQRKNLYAIVARAGEGKTNFINELVFGACRLSGFKISSLCLDTEMPTNEIVCRMVASLSGVPLWYVMTGQWRKNKDYEKKVRQTWTLIKENKYKYCHYHVKNKPIDEVVSFVRRWMGRNVIGDNAIISYDYIKLTGEKLGNNWAEHQAMGDKIDKLKKLAEEFNIPIVTAMQANRSGVSDGKKSSELTDDSSIISLTDRLQWFGSFIAIFRRKTKDELMDDGLEFGTHKLIPLKTRFQGREAAGHSDRIRRQVGNKVRYMSNFLNFNVDNFRIEEKGSLRDIVAKEAELQDIQLNSKNKGSEDAEL